MEHGYNTGEMDVSIICTHMMPEAWELGIGSVWVRGFDARQVAKAFDLPEHIKPICLLPIGYPTKLKDCEEILHAAQLYIDGCKKGDGEMMKPAFHENTTINGAPIQTLFDGATQASPADSKARVDVLNVVNDIAVIRITLENYFEADYVDFHAMK